MSSQSPLCTPWLPWLTESVSGQVLLRAYQPGQYLLPRRARYCFVRPLGGVVCMHDDHLQGGAAVSVVLLSSGVLLIHGGLPRYPLNYASPSFVPVNDNGTAFNISYLDGTCDVFSLHYMRVC